MASTLNLWADTKNPVILLNADIALAFTFTSTTNNVAVNANNPPGSIQTCSQSLTATNIYGCINPTNTVVPSTASLVSQFATNNTAFLKAFETSYVSVTSVGYGSKLPSLTPIDLTTC